MSRNIYIKSLDVHLDFFSKSQFLQSYNKLLSDTCQGSYHLSKVLEEVEEEVSRRKRLTLDSVERQKYIQQNYTRLHPEIFDFQEDFLSPDFLRLVSFCKQDEARFEGVCAYLSETNVERTYTFPVFTAKFCRLFLEEIMHFEQSDVPKGRPNTMNSYGVLLDELGMYRFIDVFRENYLEPITSLLYPDWGGAMLDSHKAFIVQYGHGKDVDLGYHYDNAEVTLNVALSPEDSFEGGDLFFGAMRNEIDSQKNWKTYSHRPTVGILHRGQHRHGAYPIMQGSRYNLIVWMRASAVRNKKCPMCDAVPDLEETTGYGDGFTRQTMDVCSVV
ncbi:hypothetical protein DPMN_163005 [Dreissena polymorpha]|uniref:Fe2OG dioxygenase domain-containing protein n=2 Tax=Dreissena polymorpha TaxID=45954 RepID=A0A9D4ERB6_DREPO|nr:hypothetical protein DPMN_163005 [Dreissena polymorpha]